MILGIKVDNQVQIIPLMLPLFLIFEMQYLNIFFFKFKPFTCSHGPKSYKTDQVGFCRLSLNHYISGLECSNGMGQKHGMEDLI